MSDHFINLACTSCGGKLDVYDDMERFACGYCGSEVLVQRRGGTVALKAVTEAIKQVQVGTDKTAAELAIIRYERELQELRARSMTARSSKDSARTTIRFGWWLVVTGALSEVYLQSFVFGIVPLLGFAVIFFGHKAKAAATNKGDNITEKIDVLKRKVTEKKKVVEA